MSDNIARQKQFKNAGKHEEMRRRRAEGSLELRKQRKDEQLMKRRNIDAGDTDDEQISQQNAGDMKPMLPLSECLKIMANGSGVSLLSAVESLRRHLSRPKTPPIDEVIAMGFIPYLIKAVDDPSPKVQFEAAWALTNITSGSSAQTMAVIEAGAIDPLVGRLSSDDTQVAEQCAWALANITGESVQLRDVVIKAGMVDPLIKLSQRGNLSVDCVRTIAWTFSNLCRYKTPPVSDEVVHKLVPTLCLLIHNPDKSVVIDTIWALAYLSDGCNERITMVLKMGVIGRLIQCAINPDPALMAPSLRTLGNIVSGDDQQTQAVLDQGILVKVLPVVLSSGKQSLAREACWLISNVCAGTTTQIQAVLDCGIIPCVIEQLEKGDFRTQVEATWAVYNVCSGGTTEQMCYLLNCGALLAISRFLKDQDSRTLILILDTLRFLLEAAANMGQLEQATILVEECGGVDQLEKLQNHENEEVYKRALQLIEKYFTGEEVQVNEIGGAGDDMVQFEKPAEGYNF